MTSQDDRANGDTFDRLYQRFGPDGWKKVDLAGIRQLKAPQGAHVYGESEYTFHSSSDQEGRTSQQSGGHRIINEDGRVNEFDFKPTFDQNPLLNLKAIENTNGQAQVYDFKPTFTLKDLNRHDQAPEIDLKPAIEKALIELKEAVNKKAAEQIKQFERNPKSLFGNYYN